MKKIQMLGLALFAVCAFSAVAAASAFAESEWLLSGAAIPSTAKEHVEVTGKLTLLNSELKVGVECEGGGLGFVWEKEDVQEEATAKTCTTVEGSCGTPFAEAVDLNWNTLIVLVGAIFKDQLLSSGKGEPGWKVTCFGILSNECKTEAGENELTNGGSGEVLSAFNQGFIATCNGKANTGKVEGTVKIVALTGLALTIS